MFKLMIDEECLNEYKYKPSSSYFPNITNLIEKYKIKNNIGKFDLHLNFIKEYISTDNYLNINIISLIKEVNLLSPSIINDNEIDEIEIINKIKSLKFINRNKELTYEEINNVLFEMDLIKRTYGLTFKFQGIPLDNIKSIFVSYSNNKWLIPNFLINFIHDDCQFKNIIDNKFHYKYNMIKTNEYNSLYYFEYITQGEKK